MLFRLLLVVADGVTPAWADQVDDFIRAEMKKNQCTPVYIFRSVRVETASSAGSRPTMKGCRR
jgi:hypothetical protein